MAIAPIRIAIEVVYRDTKEVAFTKFVDVNKLLETVNDLDIKLYVVGRLYPANNLGKEYEALDDEEIEDYEDLRGLEKIGLRYI